MDCLMMAPESIIRAWYFSGGELMFVLFDLDVSSG